MTGLSEPSIFGGCVPWKWIECGCSVSFVNVTLRRSSCVSAEDRAGDGAVVRPRVERDVLHERDLAVVRGQLELTDAAGVVRLGERRDEQVEIALGGRDRAGGSVRVLVVLGRLALHDARVAAEHLLGERDRGSSGHRAREKPLAADPSHRPQG